jgi:hypothetical protein
LSRFATLHRYWEAGLAVAIGSAFFLLSRDAIKSEFTRGPLAAAIVVVVLAVTFLEFVLYLFETQHELEISLDCGLVERTGQRHWLELATVLVVAACLGGLISFVTQPLVYTAILIVFEVAECIGTYFAQRAVLKVYREHRNRSADAIFEYYLFKPHFLRLTFRLGGFFFALTLALIGMYSKRLVLNQLAWLTVVMTFIASEVVIWRWRGQRDHELQKENKAPPAPSNNPESAATGSVSS